MFKCSTKFDDFDEFLKDLGRKRFLQRFGSDETNVRIPKKIKKNEEIIDYLITNSVIK